MATLSTPDELEDEYAPEPDGDGGELDSPDRGAAEDLETDDEE